MYKLIINDSFKMEQLFEKINEVTFNKLSEELQSNKFYELSKALPSEIKIINNNYRKIDKPTDVLSFELKDNNYLLGEIFICEEISDQQAKEKNVSKTYEICLLFAHGLLHLLGYDHLNKDDEKIMFDLQEDILRICLINKGIYEE